MQMHPEVFFFGEIVTMHSNINYSIREAHRVPIVVACHSPCFSESICDLFW